MRGNEAPTRLTRWPALDGMRGLGLLVVLTYHHDAGWVPGGFLSVSMFFTLSGFLITSLVVAERRRTGKVRIGAFWTRRLRRLAPVALLGLAFAIVTIATVVPAAQRGAAVGDVRASLAYVANWRFVVADAPYFDLTTVPSPVLHFWSLAIEEQFYVLFPLVAVVALRRREAWLAVAFVAITAFSIWRQIDLGMADRTYYGTDTRAAEIAIGGLLALGHHGLRRVISARAFDVMGWFALAASVILWFGTDHTTPGVYHGGFAAFAVVSAMWVMGSVEGPTMGLVLGRGPLPRLGNVSYGVYVFHLPLYIILSEQRVGFGGPALLGLRLAAALAVATAVYFLLEQPIRTGALRPSLAAPGLVFAVAAVALVPIVAVDERVDGLLETGIKVESSSDLPSFVGKANAAQRTTTTAVDNTAATSSGASDSIEPRASATPAVAAPSSSETKAGQPNGSTAAQPATTEPPPAPPRPARIVVVGDSTAGFNGRGLAEWGADTGTLEVTRVSGNGCTVLVGDRLRVREGYEYRPDGCETLFDQAIAEVRNRNADALVVFTGSNQLADWRFDGNPTWRTILEPDVQQRYRNELHGVVDRLGSLGIPVLWNDVPQPNFDPDRFAQNLGGTRAPGFGPCPMNEPARTTALNALTNRAVSEHRIARIIPFAARLAGPDGVIEDDLRSDGMHLTPETAYRISDEWLFDELRAGYQAVVADESSGARAPEHTTLSA